MDGRKLAPMDGSRRRRLGEWRWLGADQSALEDTNRRMAEVKAESRPAGIDHIAMIVGFGFAGAIAARLLGDALPVLGDPTIISHTTWAVLIVVTGGLILSFTPIRKLDEVGASNVGFVALYLMLTGIGAQGNLIQVLDAPAFFFAGMR